MYGTYTGTGDARNPKKNFTTKKLNTLSLISIQYVH